MEAKKTILRAQWDGRKQMWKVVEKTYNGAGGWKKIVHGLDFWEKHDAGKCIDNIIENNPEKYEKEA